MSDDIINSGEETTKSKDNKTDSEGEKTENKNDTINNKGGDGNLELLINVLFMSFLVVGIMFFMTLLLNGELNLGKGKRLLPFVIISTSIVAGSFFIIKTYIRSEIGIRETEMGKEFREDIKRIAKEIDQKFDEQKEELIKEQTKRFDEQKKEIKEVFDERSAIMIKEVTEVIRLSKGGAGD